VQRYKRFIEENLKIIDKQGQYSPFILNKPQNMFIEDYDPMLDVLKARQEGFSTLIDAIFTTDFLLVPNSYSVIVADIEENAEGLLDRVKIFIESYEDKNKIKIPLKYNSRFELYNSLMRSRIKIGTAKNSEFGRSKTISNLHLSECAFYSNIEKILAGAGQAVVEGGRLIIETTANGYNDYRKFRASDNGFKKVFYKASLIYDTEFLDKKRKQLGELFKQEYPETEHEAFVTSGQCYVDKVCLDAMWKQSRESLEYGQFQC
jgi:hypothetical protein